MTAPTAGAVTSDSGQGHVSVQPPSARPGHTVTVYDGDLCGGTRAHASSTA